MTVAAAVERTAFVEQVMGLPVSIHVRGPRPGDDAVTAVVERAFARLRDADRVFSTYRADSDISRINRGDIDVADADPSLATVLELAERARRVTGGRFDVRLPGPSGRRHLDPSGIVKGWAAQRACEVLDTLSGHDYCLNAGGDVSVGGDLPGSPPWRVGIEWPGRPGLVGVVERREGAVATSGTAARGAHLVDPRTGATPHGLLAATVTGPSLMWADVLATAAFVEGADAIGWIRAFPGFEVLVVTRAGAVLSSTGFEIAARPPRG